MKTRIMIGIFALSVALPAIAENRNQGFIYGTVYTDSGNEYRGTMRWGREEAFWDDHFNSSKTDLPYMRRTDDRDRRRERIRIFGWTVGYRWQENAQGRQFIARFGDIAEIRPRRGEKVEVLMRSGSVYDIDGGSNDIGAKITVNDESLGQIKLDWDRIDRIVFAETPKNVEPVGWRLHGTVETSEGPFSGWIQWDNEECLSIDKLDGDSEDGDVSIEMGRILSIEKRGRRGSWVELRDGRRFYLDNSNDIDDDNRGIFVEDGRYGRAKIEWSEFDRIVFDERGASGRGFKEFKSAPLRGRVSDTDGRSYTGRIVFDLDESESWELLNGERHGIGYDIPFAMIKWIEPRGDNSSEVALRSGEQLVLRDGNDVTDGNDGIVVLDEEGKERFIAWPDVDRVEFN